MPLAVGTITTPPPVDPGVPTPPVTVETDRLQVQWFPPDGSAPIELTEPGANHGWFTTRGVGGWGAVPVSRIDDQSPRGGVTVRHVRDEPRSITWPLHVWGDTSTEMVQRMRRLVRAFTMTRDYGPGTLRVSRPSGGRREILAYYEDGLGGDVGQGYYSASPVLTLFCPDGFWRAVDPVVDRRSYGADGGGVFLNPFMTVASSRTLSGPTEIINPGDTDAWPVWTITGPADGVVATNHTTGESFTLTYDLAAEETITITTDPPTVRGPAGEVLTGALNWPGAVLWPLKPGRNEVEFAVTESAAGTEIALSYTPRYEMW